MGRSISNIFRSLTGRPWRAETVRTPATPAEARQQVDALQQRGVDGIKAILEAGQGDRHFNRLDVTLLQAIAEEARARKLPIVVHTGDARDVADALNAGVNGIEHGSSRELIPPDLFVQMKVGGVTYDPTLSVWEGYTAIANGTAEELDRPLVLQAVPAALIASTKEFLNSTDGAKLREGVARYGVNLDIAKQNLVAAWHAGVTLVTGSDAGNPLVLHGPTIEREVELWVDAGLPPAVALQAATYNAARLLGADGHIGIIEEGRDANLMFVTGDPSERHSPDRKRRDGDSQGRADRPAGSVQPGIALTELHPAQHPAAMLRSSIFHQHLPVVLRPANELGRCVAHLDAGWIGDGDG